MNQQTYPITAHDEWPIGAHLVTPRRGYTHHGIYAGGGRVIHYAGFSRTWWRGPVEEVSLEEFCLGRSVAMRDSSNASHWGAARVERARQRLGENRFSIWSNNCEHFCNWCAHGASHSAQIEALRGRLAAIVSATTSGNKRSAERIRRVEADPRAGGTTMILRRLFISLAAFAITALASAQAQAQTQTPDAFVKQLGGDVLESIKADKDPAR